MSVLTPPPPVGRAADVVVRSLRAADRAKRRKQPIYALLPVKGSHRVPFEPRVERHWRPKAIAAAGPTAFFRNRFYNIDQWYKARIDRPMRYPNLHRIQPLLYHQTLEERLAEMQATPDLEKIVDIGFSESPTQVSREVRRQHRTKDRLVLERAARNRTLEVDIDAIDAESSQSYYAARVVRQAAHHYGIFRDCFHEHAYFTPIARLNVAYDDNTHVYIGNECKPADMQKAPSLTWQSAPDSTWLLLCVNLDGCLYKREHGVLHWLVTDIKGGNVSTGRTVAPYMPPLPPFGTGYNRLAFLLFSLNNKVQLPNVDETLESRTLDPRQFYKQNERSLTPAMLSFCQCVWDDSVRQYMQKTLKIPHPQYEFEWPKVKKPEQEVIPEVSTPFNEYLERYAGTRAMEEKLLRERLANLSPFEPAPKPPMHNLHWQEDKHSMSPWLFTEQRKKNLAIGKYRALYENALTPSKELAAQVRRESVTHKAIDLPTTNATEAQ